MKSISVLRTMNNVSINDLRDQVTMEVLNEIDTQGIEVSEDLIELLIEKEIQCRLERVIEHSVYSNEYQEWVGI